MTHTDIEQVVIIGSGPAGLTAALYTARAKLNPLLIMGSEPGGQLARAAEVENWPGKISILGPNLIKNLQEQARACGTRELFDVVTQVITTETQADSTPLYILTTKAGKEIKTRAVIIACGATHRMLGCPGESEYWGKGVAVCATCDAPFYKDKKVIVVGGGNSAVSYADQLARHASSVTVVHILDKLTATDPLRDVVLDNPKISFIYNHTVTAINGTEGMLRKVTSVTVQSQVDKAEQELLADGVFIAIGYKPNTALFKEHIALDKWGYIACEPGSTKTSLPGIFAAGDIADPKYRQAITAAGQGCMAALDCEYYLTGAVSVVY